MDYSFNYSKVDSLKGSQEIWITPSILAGIEAIGTGFS